MQHTPYFKSLYAQYKDKVVFVAIYITEAHAADEWPVGARLSFCNQPTTVPERCELARGYVESYDMTIPVLVDNMDNNFRDKFSAWPFRFYVVNNGKVEFKAQPDPEKSYTYDVNTLGKWLQANVA